MEEINFRKVKKTQRPHRCFWCAKTIEKGSKAIYQAYKYDGDFNSTYMHMECHHAMNFAFKERIVDEFYYGEFSRGRIDNEGGPPQFDEYGEKIN